MLLNLQHDFMDRQQQFLRCIAQDPVFRHPPTCADNGTTRCDLLPSPRNTDEATVIARAFISTFSIGNNQANLYLRGHEEDAVSFLTLCLLMLSMYFGGGDYNIATLHDLFGYELERSNTSTIDHICASIGTGYQGLRMLLRDDGGLVAPTFNKGLATPTNLRRIPDGAKPYKHLRAEGQRGFTTEEDETLEAYRRYRICKRTSGLAAAQACRALTAPWEPLFQGWQREADALAQAPGATSDAADLLERLERTGAPCPQSETNALKHVDLFERAMLCGLSEAACNMDAPRADRMYYESLIATYLHTGATA